MDNNSYHSNISNVFLVVTSILFAIFGYNYLTSYPPFLCALVAGLMGVISFYLLTIIFRFLLNNFDVIPAGITVSTLSLFSSLYLLRLIGFRLPANVFYIGALALAVCLIFILWSLQRFKQSRSKKYLIGVGLPLLFICSGIYWLAFEGIDSDKASLSVRVVNENIVPLSQSGIENPSDSGTYQIEKFFYGSGTDFRREEYSDEVKYKTKAVDASLLIPAWKGKLKKWRERYWHFGVKELPINGRVYMPQSEKKAPLLLIVHGNHSMIDYSDGGYAYLGESLASRGYAVVSVDENFLNGHWSGDFRGKEMPARAWLLLKHLEQWQAWNSDPDHDLYNKIDMDNIMLVGHSRGGEAVSIAAKFNKLKYFPDNANEQFDFNFNIKSVVSIAPTDYRYHRQINLEDINYLSIQGSYDSDEISFWGMRPYHRLKFTDNESRVKAGVYMHRANHGQFNSTWGRADMGAPFKWLLNTKPMISGEDQRKAANVFISAFAEATLAGKDEYLPIFQNADSAQDWLPSNYYLTQFQKSGDVIIQDYEEDIELASGRNAIKIETQNLNVWREENLATRDNGSQENNVVILGWDYGDEIDKDSLARYTLELDKSSIYRLDSVNSILLRVAMGNQEDLKKDEAEDEKDTVSKPNEKTILLDFSIELVDSLGHVASLLISEIKSVAPILKTSFTKLKSVDKEMFGSDWEVQLQSFVLPVKKFKKSDSKFNIQSLAAINLIFDQNKKGVMVIDDIGFSYKD